MRLPPAVAAPLLLAGLVCATSRAAHAATLNVAVNHSLRLPVAGRAASVVVGNAAVADVTVVDSRTLFVTGKAPGSTDVAVVDPLGRTVFAADIAVGASSGRPVTVHRANAVAELSCDPRCMGSTPDTAGPSVGGAGSGAALAGAMAGGLLGAAAGGVLSGAGAPAASPFPAPAARPAAPSL